MCRFQLCLVCPMGVSPCVMVEALAQKRIIGMDDAYCHASVFSFSRPVQFSKLLSAVSKGRVDVQIAARHCGSVRVAEVGDHLHGSCRNRRLEH